MTDLAQATYAKGSAFLLSRAGIFTVLALAMVALMVGLSAALEIGQASAGVVEGRDNCWWYFEPRTGKWYARCG